MNDLGRRFWVPKKTASPLVMLSALALGVVLVGYGLASHRDFLAGLGFGGIIGAGLLLLSYLKKRKA
jgi:hypothetical protein